MKYKASYAAYRLKKIWPLLDELAAYSYVVNSTLILVFAIYYQIAAVWGLFLLLYILQTITSGRRHWQYRESGARLFEENQKKQAE